MLDVDAYKQVVADPNSRKCCAFSAIRVSPVASLGKDQ